MHLTDIGEGCIFWMHLFENVLVAPLVTLSDTRANIVPRWRRCCRLSHETPLPTFSLNSALSRRESRPWAWRNEIWTRGATSLLSFSLLLYPLFLYLSHSYFRCPRYSYPFPAVVPSSQSLYLCFIPVFLLFVRAERVGIDAYRVGRRGVVWREGKHETWQRHTTVPPAMA